MKKQTAVEWLVEQCFPIMKNTPTLSKIIEQAKLMEDEQNALFYDKGVGHRICLASGTRDSSSYPNYESVYNEFYETKKQV